MPKKIIENSQRLMIRFQRRIKARRNKYILFPIASVFLAIAVCSPG